MPNTNKLHEHTKGAWPPPPAVPNPLAEHDALLIALIRAPAKKRPVSRLSLIRGLRQGTGLDLQQCISVVNDFCDRFGVFPQPRGLRLWLPVLPLSIYVWLSAVLIAQQIVLGREITAAPTRVARHALLTKQLHWDEALAGLMFVTLIAMMVMLVVTSRRTRHEAEDARRRVSGVV